VFFLAGWLEGKVAAVPLAVTVALFMFGPYAYRVGGRTVFIHRLYTLYMNLPSAECECSAKSCRVSIGRVGARTVFIHRIYDRMSGEFPANNAMHTRVYKWFWPTHKYCAVTIKPMT
jgi:hypothetical protein